MSKSNFIPNSFQCPNLYSDRLFPLLDDVELRIIIYMSRRIFGFDKLRARISLRQMQHGTKSRAGDQLDAGTGITNASTLTKALDRLQQYNIITLVEKGQSNKGLANEWELQLDDSLVDWKTLEGRQDSKRHENRKRGLKARHTRAAGGTASEAAGGTASEAAGGTASEAAGGTASEAAGGTASEAAGLINKEGNTDRKDSLEKQFGKTGKDSLNTTTLGDLTDQPPHNTARRRREEAGAASGDSSSPPFPNDEEPEAEQTALSIKVSVPGVSNSWLRETYSAMKAEGYGSSWERTLADLRGWLSLPHIGQVDVEEALHLADQNGKATRAYVGGILRRRSRDRADEARHAQEMADWEERNAEQRSQELTERRPSPVDTTDAAPPASDLGAAWTETLDALRAGMNPGQFDNFLRGSTAARSEAGRVRVTLPNPVASAWLNIQSAPRASRTLSRLLGERVAVVFAAEPSTNEEVTVEVAEAVREEMAVAA